MLECELSAEQIALSDSIKTVVRASFEHGKSRNECFTTEKAS